jgi:hypothetical protein
MNAAVPRLPALMLVAAVVLAGCSSAEPGARSEAPSASAVASAPLPSAGGELVTARYEMGPPPGPVKPFRGEMTTDVQVYDGWVSMLIHLRNTGEEPVTFLNTLYDYEPLQLYEPLVRLEWGDGTAAASTRRGRFFPTPAILQPGEEGLFLLGGQPLLEPGNGELGDLVSHIKYCPSRGMDDQPGVPLEVSGLEWDTSNGITTVRGKLNETQDVRRFGSPTLGVYFLDDAGNFLGAVVDDGVGAAMSPGEQRDFEISGPGVQADRIASAQAVAWVR